MLFCDIVGSTPLASGLDPEDLREILTTYQASVGAAVAGQQGYVARFVGDGVLAYFGWPNADEAHAESAVRAGLAIIDAIGPLKLSVRVGIATGLVVTGDLIGVGAAQTVTAVGETPNLAARLQALAQPDTVVVSEATRSHLGQMFELEDLGAVPLKGFDRPVRAWRARGSHRCREPLRDSLCGHCHAADRQGRRAGPAGASVATIEDRRGAHRAPVR